MFWEILIKDMNTSSKPSQGRHLHVRLQSDLVQQNKKGVTEPYEAGREHDVTREKPAGCEAHPS